MTAHLVTFSGESMSRSRDLCVDSATAHGVDGITWAYAASEADKAAGRGLGFWAWKPRVILDFLTDTTGGLAHPDDGDILIYADAGIEFLNNVNYIIDRMDQDIFLFGNNWEHAHWCKRDVIEEICSLDRLAERGHGGVWLNEIKDGLNWGYFGKQVQASVIFFRVSDYTRKFVKEWLDWCLFEGGRLIDDSPSRTPNHPEFREHRHDQAILTTMAYPEGIKLHWWPAVYNKGGSPEFIYERGDYPDEGYPVLFSHHRRRNREWAAASIGNLVTSLERFNDAMSKAESG